MTADALHDRQRLGCAVILRESPDDLHHIGLVESSVARYKCPVANDQACFPAQFEIIEQSVDRPATGNLGFTCRIAEQHLHEDPFAVPSS